MSIDRGASLRRLSIGWLAAVALLLVAFEWRSGPSTLRIVDHDLGIEDDYQPMPIVLHQRDPAPRPIERERIRTSISVVVGDPDELRTIGDPDPVPDAASPVGGIADPREMNPPELTDPGPMPWTGVEQRPYFKACLDVPRAEIDACTEDGIDRHLQKHFRAPAGMRGADFTVVTFVIEADGAIGRIACVPKPRNEIRQEIERVLRTMPAFMPATQNGRPVPVVYQMPFRVTRR